jgi:tRNA (mo5U34)-methyltransferase
MLTLYKPFWDRLKALQIDEDFRYFLIDETHKKLEHPIQGDYPRWLSAYKRLPDILPTQSNTDANAINCGIEIRDKTKEQVNACLQELIPWRKGPFNLFGTYIDSEWQSFMKWNRIENKIPNLANKRVLDVGCGNGYYMFRMSSQNPILLMGIDPGLLQVMQFWAVEKYINSSAAVLPLAMQDLPKNLNCFDVVFSMGVLYHRKSPIHHIKELAGVLQQNGHLIIETLVIDGDKNSCLIPTDRYAQMRNVWFLPSIDMLKIMLKRCGFHHIECIDVTTTAIEEQRSTEWMKFHSLKQFLDKDQQSTIEGYSLPKRATLVAQKK